MWKKNYAKFLVSTHLGPCLGTPIFPTTKEGYDPYWERIRTGVHNTLLIIGNEKVNQSRGATCYSSGFSYHLCQLVHI